MDNDNLHFNIGSKIKVEGTPYVVEGAITFKQNDGSKWTEYRIRSQAYHMDKWLSVDTQYDEYALYTKSSSGSDFSSENMGSNGYKMVEDNYARVIDYKGNVDVDLGDIVSYREYEDSTEELLLSIEQWDDEIEYSKGHYVDKNSIEKIDSSSLYEPVGLENNSIKPKHIIYILMIGFIVVILLSFMKSSLLGLGKKESLSNFIKSNENFIYVTSITSDLDSNKKADVYSTNSSVEDASMLIIEGIKGNIADAQENREDGTVVITTSDELALIYTSEDNETLVQLSTREYVYSSRSNPYRSHHTTGRYYRSYYFGRVYQEDRNRFGKAPDGYSDFSGEGFTSDDNNRYKVYSNSVRQSSTSTRSSSGGGTSFGK